MIKRISLTFLLLFSLVSQAAASDAIADPRTMAFPPLKFQIPATEKVSLDNGMTVYLLEDHELPMVNVSALIKTGSIYEPPDKAGLAGLVGAVMRSGGTKAVSPEDMDRELEFMASSIETSIGADAGNASMSALKKNLGRTLELFSQVLMNPVFSAERVLLAKNRTLEALRRQNDDPKGVGDRELNKALYSGHPLGRYPTPETVKGITRDDMVSFQSRYYHPNSVTLAVSGDFDRGELLRSLNRLFGGWKPGNAAFPAVPEPSATVPSRVLLARKPVNQSVIRMGHLGIEKSNPDIYAVKVMDFILGGGFTSRLTTEVRSNQGLAYNVDAYFDVGRRFVGIFKAETETKSETTIKAISLMRDIIAGMTRAPVSGQELKLAKDAIINSFIFGFANASSVVSQRARLEYYGYAPGYLENYRDNIAKVTEEDVLRVARKYLRPESMVTVVVGDDARFDKPLSTLGGVEEIKLQSF